MVELAVKNPRRKIKEIYATKETAEEVKIPSNVSLRSVDRKFLDSLVGQNTVHQGIVAKCDPLPVIDLKEFVRTVESKERCLLIILDQVTDPHNIGAIMRSAVAFNASAVIMPEAGAPGETGPFLVCWFGWLCSNDYF